jgi:VanZ family protein
MGSRLFAGSLHLMVVCDQIALFSRGTILDHACVRAMGWGIVMTLDAGTALTRPVIYPGHREDYDSALSAVAASADIKYRFRTVAKCCGVPIVVLLVIAALGPAKWAPRTEFGWQFDHFIGYFGIVLFFCFAWPRPFLVGGAFMALAALLEGLQAFTPDRSAYLPAIFYGAGGALAASLIVKFFMLVWRRHLEVLALRD